MQRPVTLYSFWQKVRSFATLLIATEAVIYNVPTTLSTAWWTFERVIDEVLTIDSVRRRVRALWFR